MLDRPDEIDLIERLRARDEDAFRSLVRRYHGQVVSVARLHVATQAVAEEVAQETWLGVLRGIDAFEGRSSFSTWLFRIASNRAKTRGAQEKRTVPFAAMSLGDGPAVDPDQFNGMMMWAEPVGPWSATPEQLVGSDETIRLIRETVDRLPDNQRAVVMLRDMYGWTSAAVCDELEISEANQRVLLHRGRVRVRQVLDAYLRGGEVAV